MHTELQNKDKDEQTGENMGCSAGCTMTEDAGSYIHELILVQYSIV